LHQRREQATPRARQADEADHPVTASGAPVALTPPRTALVVDDDPDVATLIGRLLDRNGWRTLVATSPERALAMSRGVPLDLLVTDFEMPVMTGLDLAAHLWRGNAELPVLVVSGWTEAAQLVTGPRLTFLAKPLNLSVLLTRAEEMAHSPCADASPTVRSPARAGVATHCPAPHLVCLDPAATPVVRKDRGAGAPVPVATTPA
jgi:CheY-like chemotaxis protein